MSLFLWLAPPSASMLRFNRGLLRRTLIIVLPLRDLIWVGLQNPQVASAQPIAQIRMMGQLGELFVLRSAIADEARY